MKNEFNIKMQLLLQTELYLPPCKDQFVNVV